MRVTENMKFSAALLNSQKANERLYEATRAASSGLRVQTPSDDPAAYAVTTARDARIVQLGTRKEAIGRARGEAELAENTLASAAEVMVRARELSLQLSNGEMSADDRAAGALEVAQLRETLIGLANTRGPTGYLFGGTATDAPPFDAAGTFLGNDGILEIEVADGVRVAANASGADAFTNTTGGRDLFQDLADLEAAMNANDPTAIANLMDEIDEGHRQLVGARTDAGLALDRFLTAEDVADRLLLTVKAARAAGAEVDATEAFSELSLASAAFERNLEVTRQILSLNLTSRT